MLKVNLRDGKTLNFDLDDENGRKVWLDRQTDRDFQRQITGIGIHHGGVLHVLPIPSRFHRVSFLADVITTKRGIIGQQVECHADDVKTTLSVYYATDTRPRLVRVNVAHIGKPRYLAPDRPPQQEVAGRQDRALEEQWDISQTTPSLAHGPQTKPSLPQRISTPA